MYQLEEKLMDSQDNPEDKPELYGPLLDEAEQDKSHKSATSEQYHQGDGRPYGSHEEPDGSFHGRHRPSYPLPVRASAKLFHQ